MKTILLPIGASHVQFDELAHVIADALWPDMGEHDTRMSYAGARLNLEAELLLAVRSSKLPVKDPLTFGPHSFPVGAALRTALVEVGDLRAFVADRGIDVQADSELQDILDRPESEIQVKQAPAAEAPAASELCMLIDVALWIAKQEGWQTSVRESFLKQMMAAAAAGKLTLYDPEIGITRLPKSQTNCPSEFTTPNEVNKWLMNDGGRLTWVLHRSELEADQETISGDPTAKPLQRSAAQDAAILKEIEKQGYDPLALPRNRPGKSGAKAAIRIALSKNQLFVGNTVFDKAWERLTASACIKIQS